MEQVSQEEIFEKIKPLLIEQLGCEEDDVTLEANFQENLDADSLDLVELIMELEDQFGLKIPDDDAKKLTTVGEAVQYIYDHQPDDLAALMASRATAKKQPKEAAEPSPDDQESSGEATG